MTGAVEFIIAIAFILLGIWFITRIFKTASRYQLEDQPPEAVPPGEVDVRQPKPGRPPLLSGAVALEEPEEEIDTDAYCRP